MPENEKRPPERAPQPIPPPRLTRSANVYSLAARALEIADFRFKGRGSLDPIGYVLADELEHLADRMAA